MSTRVDSNVLIDPLERPNESDTWSSKQVREAGDRGLVVINPIVLAELAIGFEDVLELERFLISIDMTREGLPWSAAFQAGKAHAIYRRRGGLRQRTLPDFLIGAHAVIRRYRLLTRDSSRYRTYFPTLDIIAPDTHP